MPYTMYPGVGQQGPVQPDDPRTALARLLGVHPDMLSGGGPDDSEFASGVDALRGGNPMASQQSAPQAAASTPFSASAVPTTSSAANLPGGTRNQALSEAISKKYGVPDAGNGSSSQQDLESLDTFMRGHDVADKSAIATAPVEAAGRNQMALEGQKGKDALALGDQKGKYGLQQEDMRGQYGLEGDRIKANSVRDAALAKKPEMGPDGMPVNEKPLDAVSQRTINALQEGAPIVGQLEQLLDPSKNQALDKVSTLGKWMAYKSGIGLDPKDQTRMQLAGLLKVLGAAPYVAGSRHFEFMKQAQEHLTDPAATDAFLYNQIQELKRIWPELQQGVITAHKYPGAPLNFGGASSSADPYADPNYQPR